MPAIGEEYSGLLKQKTGDVFHRLFRDYLFHVIFIDLN